MVLAIISPSARHAKVVAAAVIMLEWCLMATDSYAQLDSRLIAALREIVGAEGVTSRPAELKVYECDGWTIEKTAPDLLVRPRSTAHCLSTAVRRRAPRARSRAAARTIVASGRAPERA